MKLTKDEYIRRQIQYENLRRANQIFLVALLVVPIVLFGAQMLAEDSLWHIGDTLLWVLLTDGLLVLGIVLIHKKAAELSEDCCSFLLSLWIGYLLVSDLMAFDLQNSESSQIILWCATIVYVVCYLSGGKGAYVGLLLQMAGAAGLIIFYRLSLGIIVYNVLLLIVCFMLEKSAYRMCWQRAQDQWSIRLANQRSERDPMTKLLNRRGFEPRAQQMILHCRKKHRPAAMLMIDIDNFKKYNDTFGHPQGDACIQAVAAQVQRLTDEANGVCARLGGEEFAVMLRGMSQVDVQLYANRLRLAVETLKLQQAADNFYPYVTISIGMDFHDLLYTVDYERMYQTADQALYRAKKNGRNCIYMNDTRITKGIKHFFA